MRDASREPAVSVVLWLLVRGPQHNAALKLVGEGGSVISLDGDEAIVERAAGLLAEDAFKNVRLLVGDGRLGYPDAPYARLAAWAPEKSEAPHP